MTLPASTQPFPRIYRMRLSPENLPGGLEAHLERCAALGFDHVLVPTPVAAFANPADSALHLISDWAARARACGLHLLLEWDPGMLADSPEMRVSQPHWFEQADSDSLPDPRRPPAPPTSWRLRFQDPKVAGELLDFYQKRLRAWKEAGVRGLCCRGLAETPAAFWWAIIGERRTDTGLLFLAWTPGCTPAQIRALEGCGFAATFSSAAWWDYRSPWLVGEVERLTRVAPPIAFPDSPDTPVLARAPGADDPERRAAVFRRALRLAALSGQGILVPMGFEDGQSGEHPVTRGRVDLTGEIRQVNTYLATEAAAYKGPLRLLTGEQAPVSALLREPTVPDCGAAALLLLANPGLEAVQLDPAWLAARAAGRVPQGTLWPGETAWQPGSTLSLAPAEALLLYARPLPPVLLDQDILPERVDAAVRETRIAIESVSPAVDAGRFAIKRTVGDLVTVEADVFVDGHDHLAVCLLWRAGDEADWQETRMVPLGNDRFRAAFPVTRPGPYFYTVEAWKDVFGTYRDELQKKTDAGQDVRVEVEEGRLLVEAACRRVARKNPALSERLKLLVRTVKGALDEGADNTSRIAALLAESAAEMMQAADGRAFRVRANPVLRVDVERPAARFASWYELFPRSQSGTTRRHGTFADVIERLPAIAAMGFDTLYFPPIHPIGRKHRKGPNNSLEAGPEDPGSPYAIGAPEGGHDALHPELGTLEDFRRLREAAARHGLELALDFAIQCSPDHPWLKEHPDWFAWRPDGTIRYAENPPKKYQDIVNVDFYAKGATPGLWLALRDAVLFWVNEGVRVFRVDNPHTKPLPFWEWLIREVRGRYPDVIFLSEAFTRPKMMYRLAKVGYSQSYTYFTWRHTKAEFVDYLTELTTTNVREFFRPHFFVNTPDINPYFLQRSGRPGHLIRAALATTLSGLWGMYSGFELCEATPVPGKEEYLDSEKYEIRAWDWQRPGNIIGEISVLNRIRRENPALQSHLNVRFLNAGNDNILYFLKTSDPACPDKRFGDNVILVAVNLDPFNTHESSLEVPLWEFGLPDDGVLEVDDLLQDQRVRWTGKHQRIRLDPAHNPYAIWRVRRQEV